MSTQELQQLVEQAADLCGIEQNLSIYYSMLAILSEVFALIHQRLCMDRKLPWVLQTIDEDDSFKILALLQMSSLQLRDKDDNAFTIYTPLLENIRIFRNNVYHHPQEITIEFLHQLHQDLLCLTLLPPPFGLQFKVTESLLRIVMNKEDQDETLITIEKSITELKQLDNTLLPIISRVTILDGKFQDEEANFLRYNGTSPRFFLVGSKRRCHDSNKTRLRIRAPRWLLERHNQGKSSSSTGS